MIGGYMKKNKKTGNFEFVSKKPINLYCFTDVHIGHNAHDFNKFNKILERLKKDPDGYCFFNGDSIDFTPDGRFDATNEQGLRLKDQVKEYKKLLKSLGKKVLFHRIGNHEARANKALGEGLADLLIDMDNIPILHEGYDEFEIVIAGNRHRLVTSHGEGGNSDSILTKLTLTLPGADFYFSGHTHDLFCDVTYAPYIHMGKKIQKKVFKVAGGTFEKPEAAYARTRNMVPKQTGCFIFNINLNGIDMKEMFV
jgi:hypothetical protein